MRRALLIIAVVTLALPAAAQAGTPAAQAGPAAQADTRLQANKAIARRDTRALLASLRLPAGSTHTATQPPLPALVPPRVFAVHAVAVSDWWTSSASPAAVLAYVKAHQPRTRGYYQISWSSSNDTLMWTIDGAHLYSQQLEVTVATLANGRTGIMAQAQSVWMVPRPLSEQLPAGVRSVAVTLRIGTGLGGMKHQRTHSYRLTRTATVATVVHAIDALPISQPGMIMSCPAMFAGMPRLTLRFLSATGSVLARAQVNVYPGHNGGSGWNSCDPIDLWIGGRPQTPLTSQTFVKRIAKLIGADIS